MRIKPFFFIVNTRISLLHQNWRCHTDERLRVPPSAWNGLKFIFLFLCGTKNNPEKFYQSTTTLAKVGKSGRPLQRSWLTTVWLKFRRFFRLSVVHLVQNWFSTQSKTTRFSKNLDFLNSRAQKPLNFKMLYSLNITFYEAKILLSARKHQNKESYAPRMFLFSHKVPLWRQTRKRLFWYLENRT